MTRIKLRTRLRATLRTTHRAALGTAVTTLSPVLLAACLALPPAACPQAQTAPTQDTFLLHGVVLDAHTGKPLARALVEAYNGHLAALTDHDGRFALTLHFAASDNGTMVPFQRSLLNAGSLYLGLTARKPGYSQDNTQRQFQQVSVSALDGDLVVKLTPDSSIQGRVATSGDDHPEGITISLFTRRIQNGEPQWSIRSVTATNSRGEFRFAGLQPGRYRLLTHDWSDDPAQPVPLARADKPVSRYPPTSYPAIASGPDLRLTAGETEQVNFNLHPQTYFPVRIPVVLPAGGNAGLQTRVERPGSIEGAQSGFSLRYNARDKVVEGVLPSGSYEIALQTNGPSGSAATVPLTVGGSRLETAPVTLQPMASIPVIVHQDLTKAAQTGNNAGSSRAIAGRLQGGIIAGAAGHGDFSATPVQVLLVPPPGSGQTAISHRRNDGPDETVLEPVAPGTYRMQVTPNYGGYVAAATSGGTDLLRQPLVVTAGSGVEPIEVTVRDDTATIRGTIDSSLLSTNSSGNTTAGADAGLDSVPYDPANLILVTCIPTQPNGQRLPQNFARRNGRFVIDNLPPGSYRVYASHVPFDSVDYRSESFTREYGGKGVPVTVEPNGSATVTLTSVIEEVKDP